MVQTPWRTLLIAAGILLVLAGVAWPFLSRCVGRLPGDVVVDMTGESTWMTSLRSAAKGGRIVTCGATTGPNPKEEIRLIFWKQLSILGSTMANDREFRALYAAVAAGRLRPRIDSVYPFSRAGEAYARMESGRQHGKIVLVPDGAQTEWPDGD